MSMMNMMGMMDSGVANGMDSDNGLMSGAMFSPFSNMGIMGTSPQQVVYMKKLMADASNNFKEISEASINTGIQKAKFQTLLTAKINGTKMIAEIVKDAIQKSSI